MFKRGDVILAPCRGDDGYELRPHWMVVLHVDPEDGAIYAVFTTSTKEGLSGGQYSFTEAERVLAGFQKPSRFVPERVWKFAPGVHHLIQRPATAGRVSSLTLDRIASAVYKRRPVFQEYKLAQ